MNIIKVKDFNSMQAITVGLARNGYFVTADSVTDENYKDHWEIKYCEISKIKEHDEKVSKVLTPEEEQLNYIHELIAKGPKNFEESEDEKPLVENEKEVLDPNPAELTPRHSAPNIPNIDHESPDSEPKIMEVRNYTDDYIRD